MQIFPAKFQDRSNFFLSNFKSFRIFLQSKKDTSFSPAKFLNKFYFFPAKCLVFENFSAVKLRVFSSKIYFFLQIFLQNPIFLTKFPGIWNISAGKKGNLKGKKCHLFPAKFLQNENFPAKVSVFRNVSAGKKDILWIFFTKSGILL